MDKMIKLIFINLMCLFLWTSQSNAALVTANSCSSTDVANAISAASSGSTILVPSGTCTWSNPVTINKSITIQGAGIDQTIIKVRGFDINAGINDYRITGFTFDGNWGSAYIITHSQSRTGNKRFRIDHNKFMNKAYTTSGTIVFYGYSYGVLDHNIFQDCLDEILSLGSDGANSLARDNSLGGYENGTIFVEDNQFTLTNAVYVKYGDQHYAAENIFDGNSGPRVTFRYNTITDHQYCRWLSAIEAHGFESEFATVGDARAFNTAEIYNNTFVSNYPGTSTVMKFRGMHNGGAIYNNIRSGSGSSFNDLLELHNLRSHTSDDTGSLQKGSIASGTGLNGAGYTEFCHSRQSDEAGLICEHCDGQVGLCFGEINNLYVWNNSSSFGSVSVENTGFVQTDIVKDVNYYLSAKPGYVPYPYPHPLITGTVTTVRPSPPKLLP
jgi:hypothetical protein